MPKYLVGDSEACLESGEFVLIRAANPREAEERFIRRVCIKEEYYLDFVYERAVNMSFAEKFWLQTEDEKSRFSRESEIIIDDDEFRRRVRNFFGEHKDFADLYLAHYFGGEDAEPENATRVQFPDEMLAYVGVKAGLDGVCVFDLAELEEI